MMVALGVRKGAWTNEEDALLRNCVIDRHSKGKWHLVPSRTGLNRCRKSCRLRWLNYLKPNIKTGEFEEDEVDMIIRLQKLLGNRWSLIAGRNPGRTANDVKNYWNPGLAKTIISEKEKSKQKLQKVIKPHPRTFSRSSSWLSEVAWWEGLSGDLDNFDQANAFVSLMEKAPVGELLDETSKMVEEARVEDKEGDDISFDIDHWQLLENTPQSVV